MDHGGTDIRSNYLFNTTIANCEDADLVLLIGKGFKIDRELKKHSSHILPLQERIPDMRLPF